MLYQETDQFYEDVKKIVETGQGDKEIGSNLSQQFRELAIKVYGDRQRCHNEVPIDSKSTFNSLLLAAGRLTAKTASQRPSLTKAASDSIGCLVPFVVIAATAGTGFCVLLLLNPYSRLRDSTLLGA